ncbi:MAG: hypothetical protein FJY85_14135 [Deltaproteobacteria bacterium]|nr:hypothetical protein [Deltaproteobacteria bacterium]
MKPSFREYSWKCPFCSAETTVKRIRGKRSWKMVCRQCRITVIYPQLHIKRRTTVVEESL